MQVEAIVFVPERIVVHLHAGGNGSGWIHGGGLVVPFALQACGALRVFAVVNDDLGRLLQLLDPFPSSPLASASHFTQISK